jgi:hypothetical protein
MTHEAAVERVLGDLRAAVRAHHRRRRRRRLVLTAALLVLATAGVTVAAASQAPWWQDAPPAVHARVVDRQIAGTALPLKADRSRARTVAEVDGAALVAVPVGDTGLCLIPSLEDNPDIGFGCFRPAKPPAPGEDDEIRAYARPAEQGDPRWIVYGRITDTGAATLDLGRFTVPLERGGFLLADVPEDRWDELSRTANEGRILDADGRVLATACVDWGPSPRDEHAGETREVIWRTHAEPCRPSPPHEPPTLDLSRAKKLAELTLTADFSVWKAGDTIAFWSAPSSDGTICIVPGHVTDLEWNVPAGGDCRDPARPWPDEAPTINVGFGAGRIHVNHVPLYAWTVSGRVNPGAGIARMELESADGTRPVLLLGTYFFVQLPGTSADAGVLPGDGPYTLVAYAADGSEVTRVDLADAHRPFR